MGGWAGGRVVGTGGVLSLSGDYTRSTSTTINNTIAITYDITRHFQPATHAITLPVHPGPQVVRRVIPRRRFGSLRPFSNPTRRAVMPGSRCLSHRTVTMLHGHARAVAKHRPTVMTCRQRSRPLTVACRFTYRIHVSIGRHAVRYVHIRPTARPLLAYGVLPSACLRVAARRTMPRERSAFPAAVILRSSAFYISSRSTGTDTAETSALLPACYRLIAERRADSSLLVVSACYWTTPPRPNVRLAQSPRHTARVWSANCARPRRRGKKTS